MTLPKEKTYALISAIVAAIVLFLLLWFLYMPQINNDDVLDEGVMISFGDATDGGGNDMTVKDVYSPPVESQSPAAKNTPSEEELVTQKTASTVKITEKTKPTKKQPSEADLKAQEEQQRRIAEQRRRQQEAAAANNVVGGAFGSSGGSGSGTTSGDTRQGNPAGHGTSGGNDWSLNGRDLSGSLVRPSYHSNEEGKITVGIRVDAAGRVTSANIVSPTTISDASTRNGAIDAAKRTKFSSGSGVVIGTITYYYRLN